MRDREFDILMQKYHKAISNIHDLQNTLETKEAAWQKITESTKKTFKLTRSLCEMILAKDKREMKLGAEYSWSKLDIDELVSNAMKCFKEYNDNRTRLMNEIMEVSEERLDKIEELEEKLEALMTNGNIGSVEESAKFLEEMDRKKEEEKAAEKLPNKVREAIQDGGVQAVLEENEDTDKDLESLEQAVLTQLAEENENIISSTSVPVKHSKKTQKNKEKAKEKAQDVSKEVIEDIRNSCDENMMEIIKLLGDTGISRLPQINEIFIKKGYKKSAIVTAINGLQGDLKIIESTKINLPIPSNMIVIKLTQSGTRVYRLETNKKAEQSEMDKILNEYETLEHGYGIITLKELLEKDNNYKSVSIYNKKNPIHIEKNIEYIPDIICIKEKGNNNQDYFEYEISGINNTEFKNKCNKMLKITKTLNFVGPNKDVVNEIHKKVENWIEKNGFNNLKGVIIKITSIKNIKSNGLNDNGWDIIYNLSQNREPIKK